LNEHGFEPGRTVADPRGAALACALIKPRREAGPSEQMTSCRERAHIGTDFRQDHLGREPPNARGRDQPLYCIAKRRQHLADPVIEGGETTRSRRSSE